MTTVHYPHLFSIQRENNRAFLVCPFHVVLTKFDSDANFIAGFARFALERSFLVFAVSE